MSGEQGVSATVCARTSRSQDHGTEFLHDLACLLYSQPTTARPFWISLQTSAFVLMRARFFSSATFSNLWIRA